VQYAKLNLCKEHFLEYVESRVLRAITRYSMLRGVKKLLLALSGGKDSLTLLYVLNSIKGQVGLVEVIGFHLDLGIDGYSEASKKAVENACSETSTRCMTISLRDLVGFNVLEAAKAAKRPICSVCGALKRYFINLVALELGVDAVTLGHHMDDILVFALKDFVLQDYVDMYKMVPVVPGVPGLVATRLKVLYETYESDIGLYADLRGIGYVKEQCPFKYKDPFKETIRRMLDELEARAPGFKLSFARRLARGLAKASATSQGGFVPCSYCGAPSSTGTCLFCRLTARVAGKPLGPVVREEIRKMCRLFISPQL